MKIGQADHQATIKQLRFTCDNIEQFTGFAADTLLWLDTEQRLHEQPP